MYIHPQFDPIAIRLGPLAIHWYGLMYLLAFTLFILVGRLQLRRPHIAAQGWKAQDLDDLLFIGVLGVVLGGRLGYVVFYQLEFYLNHPWDIFKVWRGGMSFHGGFLGVLLALAGFAQRRGKTFFAVSDFIAPLVPLGLGAGRLGNFINGELWGRATNLPWGMVFPQSGSLAIRHPSQLYEFVFEGLLLFVVLWCYTRRPRITGAVSAVFLIAYGAFRFVVEYTREPDSFLGLLALHWSMGQWLSLPMVIAGSLVLWHVNKKSTNKFA